MHVSKITVQTRVRLFYAETITKLVLAFRNDNFCNRVLLFSTNSKINVLFVYCSNQLRHCSTNSVAKYLQLHAYIVKKCSLTVSLLFELETLEL